MIVFGALALMGFFFFSTYDSTTEIEKNAIVGRVVIWGTLDSDIMVPLLNTLKSKNSYLNDVVYVEKSVSRYNKDLLEALASGNSPDLILVSNRDVFENLNKIQIIGPNNYLIRDFNNNFADAFSVFTNSQGVIAIPFIIDPMVLYYNKKMFATAAIPLPPKNWEEFYRLVDKITELDRNNNIKKTAVAFGETINVSNFEYLLSTLFLQAGDPIVYEGKNGYRAIVNKKNNLGKILTYYTSFSNPTSKAYSWNRSLPDSLDFFLSESLATYFGFVSDIKNIRLKNPNLNFDVAEIPGYRGSKNKTVFARVWGFAIPKAAKNKGGAFKVALELTSKPAQTFLSEKMFLPPVRKEMLANRHNDPFMDIFYREAIYARSFIDPNFSETKKIFKDMVQAVSSNRRKPKEAIIDGFKELDLILEGN